MATLWADSVDTWGSLTATWGSVVAYPTSQASKMGKESVQVVELYMDKCSRTYGTAPCTASVGSTGTKKCFNTFSSCQDTANFSANTIVYRFSNVKVPGLQAPGELPIIPSLTSCQTAPTVLTPGKGVGIRASVTVNLQDHPWGDVGIDPYISSRGFDPDTVGSFWGKFLARNRYYYGRKLVVKTGFLNDDGTYDAGSMVSRTYIITKINPPNKSGQVTITATDPLKFADSEKTKFPLPSTSTLAADVTSSAVDLVVNDPDGSFLNSIYTFHQYYRIDKEIVKMYAFYPISAAQVQISVYRGNAIGAMPVDYDQALNPPAAHSAGATVQPCRFFNNTSIYDIVYELLGPGVAGLPTAYLPYSEWTSIFEPNFTFMKFTRLLTEPTGVKELLTELTQHGLMIWWDERAALVRLKPMKFYTTLNLTFGDTGQIIDDTVSVAEDPTSLITQVWFSYAQAAPLEDPKLLKSYRAAVIQADVDAGSANGYGSPSVLDIKSRWMGLNRSGDVNAMSRLQLRQGSKIRKTIAWSVDPKDGSYWVGDVVGVSNYLIQDDTGQPYVMNVLITSAQEVWTNGGFQIQYVGTEQFTFARVGAIAPNTMNDYSIASDTQKAQYAFISRNYPIANPTFSDGKPAYQVN